MIVARKAGFPRGLSVGQRPIQGRIGLPRPSKWKLRRPRPLPWPARTGRQPTRFALVLAVTAALIAPASGRDLDHSAAKAHDSPHRSDVKLYRSPDAVAERDHGTDAQGRCLAPVSGLGKQWVGLKGALDAAKKDWMERVRYDHGESFVDMSHAAEVGSRCGRVSIGSFLGRVMYRCEIVARPCQAKFVAGEGQKFASAAPFVASAPAIAPPPSAATPPAPKTPLVVRLFKEAPRLSSILRRRHRSEPAPPDPRQPSLHLAALFMGHIVVDALSTMEMAPASAASLVHRLLNAVFEFPILYRALSIGTSSSD